MFLFCLLGVVSAVPKLQLGYPSAIKLYDEAVLCPVQVDGAVGWSVTVLVCPTRRVVAVCAVPAKVSKLRFLVDVDIPGAQGAVIYAKPVR